MKKINYALIGVTVLALALVGASCFKSSNTQEQEDLKKPITLNWWGVWENESNIQTLIAAYQATHKNIKINYRRFRWNEYQKQLDLAFRSDQVPDIFSLPSSWLLAYQNTLAPMPDSVTLPVVTESGGLQKSESVSVQTFKMPTLTDLETKFVDVVSNDAILPEISSSSSSSTSRKIFGLPLSLDVLGLYINRSVTDAAGVAKIPADWTTFRDNVKKITRLRAGGFNNKPSEQFLVNGAALGTADNTNNAPEIYTLLVLQSGGHVIDFAGRGAALNRSRDNQNDYYPGEAALRFYTDFANPQTDVYTWNDQQGGSVEAFAQGRVGYLLGYLYHRNQILEQNPGLKITIVPVPDLGGAHLTMANYWLQTVSKRASADNQAAAWHFLSTISLTPDIVKNYLKTSGGLTALRSLVEEQANDEILQPFAKQVLTAKSWYKGYDELTAENIIKTAIKETLANNSSLKDILGRAVEKLNFTLVAPAP